MRVVLACAAVGVALHLAGQHFDWLALQAQPLRRAGLMAAVLAAVAALYFAVLLATGLKLRQFARRG